MPFKLTTSRVLSASNLINIRRSLQRQRRALSTAQRHRFAQQAERQLLKLRGRLPRAAKVGLYVDGFGELPTQPIVGWCRRLGYATYLPIASAQPNQRRLRFVPFTQPVLSQVPLYRHKLGMQQPQATAALSAKHLTAIFCPLVATDTQGHRLGMGGGYYDATLAGLTPETLKIGWCYDCQVLPVWQPNPWDIGMDVLVTPSGIHWCG